MPRKRITYRERIARGLRRGYTRSQAAGRPRFGELSIRETQTGVVSEQKLGEMREISIRAREQDRDWNLDPWLDFPPGFLEELDHDTRNFIFGY